MLSFILNHYISYIQCHMTNIVLANHGGHGDHGDFFKFFSVFSVLSVVKNNIALMLIYLIEGIHLMIFCNPSF
jgi:hypothetical protein